jgi:Fe2+ transport system protein FeoA
MFKINKGTKNIYGISGNDLPLPLSRVKPGLRIEIVELDAGRELWSRLTSMGLCPCTEAVVLNNNSRGPLLLSLGEHRIILGRGMAEKVIVQPCKDK